MSAPARLLVLVALVALPACTLAIKELSAPKHEEPYDYYAKPKYDYKYGVEDFKTGDHKSHWEKRDGDEVTGAYTVMEPDGTLRTVTYTANKESGFNAVVTRHGKAAHPEVLEGGGDHHEVLPEHTLHRGHKFSHPEVKIKHPEVKVKHSEHGLHSESLMHHLGHPDIKVKHLEHVGHPEVKVKHSEHGLHSESLMHHLGHPDIKVKHLEHVGHPEVTVKHSEHALHLEHPEHTLHLKQPEVKEHTLHFGHSSELKVKHPEHSLLEHSERPTHALGALHHREVPSSRHHPEVYEHKGESSHQVSQQVKHPAEASRANAIPPPHYFPRAKPTPSSRPASTSAPTRLPSSSTYFAGPVASSAAPKRVAAAAPAPSRPAPSSEPQSFSQSSSFVSLGHSPRPPRPYARSSQEQGFRPVHQAEHEHEQEREQEHEHEQEREQEQEREHSTRLYRHGTHDDSQRSFVEVGMGGYPDSAYEYVVQ